MQNRDKKKLLNDFKLMKSFEESAAKFYTKVGLDSRVNERMQNTFREMTEDEKQHVEIVQKIIDIINTKL